MKHWYDTVANQSNTLIMGASVRVFFTGSQVQAPLFSDDGHTALTQPLVTDADGRFDFFVADGRYDLQVSGPGISTFTQSNVEISDITEASSTDANWQTQILGFENQAINPTPPAGFVNLYSKRVDKNLYFKDETGREVQVGSSGGGGGGTGTVTSVGLALPLELSVTGSPVTTAGTLTGAWVPEAPINVFAGPTGVIANAIDTIATAIGSSPLSISATPTHPGDLAILLTCQDNTSLTGFNPGAPWVSIPFSSQQSAYEQVIVGTSPVTATGSTGTPPADSWASALVLFTARSGFTPVVANRGTVITGAFGSWTNAAVSFSTTAGNTLLGFYMSGNTAFSGGPSTITSFTDSQGNTWSTLGSIANPAGAGEQVIVLGAQNIAGGPITFTGALNHGNSNGFVGVFEVSNLAPLPGTPSFRVLTPEDVPVVNLTRTGVNGGIAGNLGVNHLNNGTSATANTTWHGNATWAAVNLTTDVAGNLPVGNLNFGSAASSGTFWRGDGTWSAVPSPSVPPAVSNFQQTVMVGDVAVGANSQTLIATRTATMPALGCPCRAFISYSGWINTSSSGVGYSMWVNDGSTSMLPASTGQSNGASGAAALLTSSGFSPVTYGNSASVTFSWLTQGDHSYTVKAAPLSGAGPNSEIQVAIFTSN